MIGQLGEMGVKSKSVKLFHCFGNRAMQRLTLTQQQLCVNGLTCQGMAEGKPLLGFFHHQLRRDQLFHQREQFLFLLLGDPLEEGKIETPSGDRCQHHHLPRCRTDLLKAKLHRVLDTAWDMEFPRWLAFPHLIGRNDGTGQDERFEDLFNEKGIALGQLIDGIEGCCRHHLLPIKDGPQHRLDLAARKGGQDGFLREAFAIQLGQPMAQFGVDLVIAVGQHEEQGMTSTAACKMVQELQARFIAPVHILDRKQHRLSGG